MSISVITKLVNFRCPLFLNIPSYCRMVVDPNDACCKIPVCVTPAPTPDARTIAPTASPGPGSTIAPNPNPQPTPSPQPKGNYCEKFTTYQQY